MKKDVFYSSKKFLNQDGYESDASIFCEIRLPVDVRRTYADCTLKIKDCNHQIFLTIEATALSGGEFENSLFKIDTLIEELTKFKQACIEAHKVSDERRIAEELREKEGKKNEVDDGNSSVNSERSISDPACTPTLRIAHVQETIKPLPNV